MGTQRLRRHRRAAIVVLIALVGASPFVALSGLALTSPYTSVAVAPACAQATAGIPSGRAIDVPGVGLALLLAADGDRALAAVIATGPSPHPVGAYLLDRRSGRVLHELALRSDAVAGAIDGGIAFLWDDKIGYALSASSGELLGALVRSDNYRGVFEAGGVRYLQLDAEVTAVGLGDAVLSYRTLRLAGVVDGCAFEGSRG